MPRYPRYSNVSYSLGPGPWTPAVKALIITNVVVFVLASMVPEITVRFGLSPTEVFWRGAIWQLVTYMFLHGGIGHLFWNMLSVWMFGTELERRWGTRFFTKYYFITGIGASATTLLWAMSPLPFSDQIYNSLTIGASGAIYGILFAYALYFPHRELMVYFLFPVQVKYFVIIIGAITLYSAMVAGGGIAHTAHLGGLLAGYLYLKGLRSGPWNEIKYRWLRWRMNRARGKFDVYSGGRRNDDDGWKSDWKKHIH